MMSGRHFNRLPSDDLEEDCCPAVPASFKDFGCDADDIYGKSVDPTKDCHGHGPRAGKDTEKLESGVHMSGDSGLGSIISAEYTDSSSLLTSELDRIPEDGILHSDFDKLSLGDSGYRNSQQPGATDGEFLGNKETVSIDRDEAIGSMTDSEHAAAEASDALVRAQIFQQDEDGDTLLHLATIKAAQAYAHNMLYMASSEEQLNIQNYRQQTVLHLAVLTHQAALARTLVACGTQLDMRDHWGNTALHLACRDGDLDCVQHMTVPLRQGEVPGPSYTPTPQCMPQDVSIKNYEGETCLHLAASRGHLQVIDYLVHHCNTDVNLQEGKSGRTVLHQAVESNNVGLVQFLLQLPGLQLEALTYDSRTALRLAVDRQLTKITNMLVDMGADRARANSDSSQSDDDEPMEDPYSDFTIGSQPIDSFS